MSRVGTAPPIPSIPFKVAAGGLRSPPGHKGPTAETSSNSTVSIGTMSDDDGVQAPPPPPPGSSTSTDGGTLMDDDSPKSAAVNVASGKRTQINALASSGAASSTASNGVAAVPRAHRRSFSDEDAHRHLMAMQQQQHMMLVSGSNGAAPQTIAQSTLGVPRQTQRRHSDSKKHRGHRSHRSHGGGSGSRSGKGRSSRKHRDRTQSADADYYLYLQQQQQAQMMAYQAQQQYYVGSPSYGHQYPPYRPNPGSVPTSSPRTPGGGKPPVPGPPTPLSTSPSAADYSTPPSKSSRRNGGRPRREKSLSAPSHAAAGVDMFGAPINSPGGYGSVGDPRMQQQEQKGGPITPSANFSPRRELLALAGQRSAAKTPPGGAPTSPGNYYQQGPGAGLSPGGVPMSVGANRGRTQSWGGVDRPVQPMAQLSPLREARPMATEDLQHGVAMGPPPPLSPEVMSPRHPGLGVYEAPPEETDAFLPQQFGRSSGSRGHHHHTSSHKRSASSFRKMHMRQQSVELFMDPTKGVEQPRRCRDVLFALLFYLQLGGIIYIGVRYGGDVLRPGGVGLGKADKLRTDDLYATYHNFIIVACMSGAFAVATSALALMIMMVISRRLVQVALIFSIGMAFAWGTIGIGLSPKSFVPITGIIALALAIGYTFVVYERIPFATANLRTALSGIRSNLGLLGVTFCFQAIALGVSISYAFAGVGLCDAILFGDLKISYWGQILAYTGVGLAYYWTYQVLCHVVQATVAGVIGSWWFQTDVDRTPCSEELTASFLRSTLFSFGSICFGSLLVGFVQILRQFAEPLRPNRDESVLMCLQECIVCFQEIIVSCVDGLADCFNPWAFTYVGLYGYGFLDAGRNATELFRKRGWSMIVTDDLIPNVLFMVSLVIGGVTGCFAVLIEVLDEYRFVSIEQSTLTAFLMGLTIGLILSSVLFGLISSAVNAVIVCFAGSPVEFQNSHSELSDEMRVAWREVWPGSMDITDMKISMESGGTRLAF